MGWQLWEERGERKPDRGRLQYCKGTMGIHSACMYAYTYVHKLTDPSVYDAVHCKADWPDPNPGCKLWRAQAAQKLGWKPHPTAAPNCRGYLLPWGGWEQPLELSSWGFKQGGSSLVRFGSSSTLAAGPFPAALSVDAGRVLALLRCSVRGSPQDPLPVGQPWCHRTRLVQVSSAPAPWRWLCPLPRALALYCETLHL